MISVILKYWKLIIDIVIVVALCVAFSYFDPFNMFRKTELKPTANLVSSVKSIGELVSAEYFGEVIEDQSTFSSDTLDLKLRINNFYDDIYLLINDFVDQAEVDNDKKSTFSAYELESLKSDYPDYSYLLAFVVAKDVVKSERWVIRKFKRDKFEVIQNRLILKINATFTRNSLQSFDKKRSKTLDLFQKKNLNTYKPFFFDLAELQESNRKIKDKIIMIARGSVKAGFNFDKLNDQNLIYDKGNKVVRLYGFHAEILDTIINPWFVPELKIPGYEIINSPKYSDYKKVVEIKEKCRHSLAKQANNAGILQQAQIYGHEVLENFFSTLLNEPDVEVLFSELPHNELVQAIIEDGIVDVDEAIDINDILEGYETAFRNHATNKVEELEFQKQIIINQLKTCVFEGTQQKINPYHIEYAKLNDFIFEYKADSLPGKLIYLNDTINITDTLTNTIVYLKGELGVLKTDRVLHYTTPFVESKSHWYTNSSQFINDFNCSIDLFQELCELCPNFFNTFGYPDIKLTEELFDKVDFNDEDSVRNIVMDGIKTNPNYPADSTLVISTETQRYLDYINTKPLKKMVYQTNSLIDKVRKP